MKIIFRVFILILITNIFGCKESDEPDYGERPYDPNVPVVITSFVPDSGGIRTPVVVEGENFGTDMSKIKFYFGEKRALLFSLNNDAAFITMPKQPGDVSKLSVVIDGDSVVYEDMTFKYRINAAVSTIAGKPTADAGEVNGTMQEATFSVPYGGIVVDKDDNIILSDNNGYRLRVIDQKANKVFTLAALERSVGPSLLEDGETFVTITITNGVIYRFDPELEWAPERIGALGKPSGGGYGDIIVVPQLPNHFLVVGTSSSNIYKVPRVGASPDNVEIVGDMNTSSGATLGVYNPVDGYLYITPENKHRVIRAKIDATGNIGTFEQYAGGATGGGIGDVNSAQFYYPCGLDVDNQGNIYVADWGNNRICKIDTQTDQVSVFAGGNGAGYEDGHPTEKAIMFRPVDIFFDENTEMFYFMEKEGRSVRKIAIE